MTESDHRIRPPNPTSISRPRQRMNVRPTSLLSLLTFLLLLIYYVKGLNALSEVVLLPLAGQVIAVGIHSAAIMIFTLLVRFTKRRALPVDSITAFLINLDTQLGGPITPERLILAPLVTLLFLHTPETLLGTLASGKPDIRSKPAIEQPLELGPFGGAFNKSTYYLSGQLLLSRNDPDQAYRQVAYKTTVGWVVPRKPTVWYQLFAKALLPENDAEKRITVPVNDAAILVPVSSLPQNCNKSTVSDFGFWLTFHHCGSYVGFSHGSHEDGNLPPADGFYQLHRGDVSVNYASKKGNRFVKGSPPRNMVPVNFPRADGLWDSMRNCFLNAISFNRPPSELLSTERLVLSAMVRIAGFDDFTGFSTPPAMTKGVVSAVVTSNLSRWVIVAMFFAVAVDLVRFVLSIFNFEILAPELEAMVASLSHIRGLKSVGRCGRGRKAWSRRIWGYFERHEQGGGRWIITKGLADDDNESIDSESTSDTEAETGTGRTSLETP